MLLQNTIGYRLPLFLCHFTIMVAAVSRRVIPGAFHHYHYHRSSFLVANPEWRVGQLQSTRRIPWKAIQYRLFADSDDWMDDVDRLLSDHLSSKTLTHTTTPVANKTPSSSSSSSSSSSPELSGASSWRRIDWKNFNYRSRHPIKPSNVEENIIQNRRVYIKRDDTLYLEGSRISGNKARKMLAIHDVPANEFPECIVSYGGPQSNAMVALAAVVNYKNREAEMGATSSHDVHQKITKKRFVYFTKKLPRFLRDQPSGNLFRAQTLGMELVELTSQEYKDLFGGEWGGSPDPPLGLQPPVEGDSVWVRVFEA